MDACYQKRVCNCNKDCVCDEGYECCSEIYKNKKSLYGLCVKKGTCDNSRGICKSNEKENNSYATQDHIEQFSVITKEGYDGSEENNKKNALVFLIIFLVIVLLLFLLLRRK